MKKYVVVLLLTLMASVIIPAQAKARNTGGTREVLENSFYGGLTGALIGAAFLAFREKPSDHYEDIRIGAAAGVIIGTLYGLARTTQAFAEYQNGSVAFHIPTLQFDVDSKNNAVTGSADLLRIPF
ncbi:MAG: hypothetical protein ACE5FY_04760 [Nitrospiria bacterium]